METIIIMNLIILPFYVQIVMPLRKIMAADKIMDKNELNNTKRNLVAILPKYAGLSKHIVRVPLEHPVQIIA
jgi:hypothetical protein